MAESSTVTPSMTASAEVTPAQIAPAGVTPALARARIAESVLTQAEKEKMRQEIIEEFSKPAKKSVRLRGRVRNFGDTMVVKLHIRTARDEFDNLLTAWELLDSNIVRVPRPLDHFAHKYPDDRHATGFLVMEHVTSGVQLDDLTDSHIDQVVDIIRYLATFKSTIPGGLTGGVMHGVLFEGDPPPEPGSMQKLNEWIHIRRTLWPDVTPKTFVDFGQLDMVLCHLDIAPRNILWPTDGGAPWLIDWESAAYLPRFSEFLQHELISGDREFHDKVISKLEPLSEREQELKDIFSVARGNSIRAYYGPPKTQRPRDDSKEGSVPSRQPQNSLQG